MTIKFADSTLTDKYQSEVDIILESIGYKGALTTDLSQFYDFTINPSLAKGDERIELEEYNANLMHKVRTLCGTGHVYENDTIVFAAKLLHDKLNGS